jgi:NAD+ synthetase
MKIAIIQTNPVIGDFAANTDRITAFIDQAKTRHCDLAVFPELAISGYPPNDLLERRDFVSANLQALNGLISTTRGIGVICGYIEPNSDTEGKALFNAAALFEDGQIRQQVRKQLLPTYDVFDERRYFEPGPETHAFAYKGSRIGLTICEDIWNDKDIFNRRIYHVDPVSRLIDSGADLLINISASVYHSTKRQQRWDILGRLARKYSIPIVYANQVGGNDSVLWDGVSTAFDARGRIVARALEFEEDLVTFDTQTQGEGSDQIHPIAASVEESVLKGLETGTRDYVSKCGFKQTLIGLSGGIDSALTAAIAVRALGKANVSAVFMPSPYTSRESFEDITALSRNLDIACETIPIGTIYDTFINAISPDWDGANPGVTEQNIQARIRGSILMGLSNKRGALVLSTGNKSELAVGYCTLYGDMNGGLAVISDVPKTMVYDLARLINRERTIIPERILTKPPSAELKPGQADQDDLPPYDILDPILKGYIEEHKSATELIDEGYGETIVKDVIQRVHRNEYKRYQAAPGLKVTSKAFGYGRRYPVAQKYAL